MTAATTAARVPLAPTRVPTPVLFIGVAAFWGMNIVAMRVAGRYVPPLTTATARSLFGGAVLLLIARRTGADWPRGRTEWTGIAWIALLMTGLSTACLFLAARNAPAGLVSIFSNTMPLFVALSAPILLSENVTRRAALGLAVGLCGTVIVAWRAIEGEIKVMGVVFGLLGALTAALGSVMYKRHSLPRLDRLMVVAVQLLLSSVLLGVMSIPDNRSHLTFPWQFFVSFVYLSLLGLALSFVFWSELLGRGSGLQASSVAYLSTVLGVIFGAILLGERLSWAVLLGGVIAIVGVALVQSGPGARTTRAVRTGTAAAVETAGAVE